MYRAHVDTPWTIVDGQAFPELAVDPQFAALLRERADVTGEGNNPPRLNYAKATGLLPSGDPDYLTVEVVVDELAALESMDADDRYWVYYSEEIPEPEGVARAASPYKPREGEPPANEWGQLRSKLARRGVPQWWIDLILGTDPNKRRDIHDFNMRQGYLNNQIGDPGAGTVDIPPLVTYLSDEGWRCTVMGGKLVVFIEIDGKENVLVITEAELLDCAAHGTNRPAGLWADIHEFALVGGYCE